MLSSHPAFATQREHTSFTTSCLQMAALLGADFISHSSPVTHVQCVYVGGCLHRCGRSQVQCKGLVVFRGVMGVRISLQGNPGSSRQPGLFSQSPHPWPPSLQSPTLWLCLRGTFHAGVSPDVSPCPASFTQHCVFEVHPHWMFGLHSCHGLVLSHSMDRLHPLIP